MSKKKTCGNVIRWQWWSGLAVPQHGEILPRKKVAATGRSVLGGNCPDGSGTVHSATRHDLGLFGSL